ncbi:dipeptidase PepV [Nosocomiicoccus sp. HMSC059G07]|uniref:dipeptidase PepV n=1 Tax=Nosocomiicoccus sp. HMSC059G07 TaxID=1739531 RepID=UPI0008A3F196|nr:dipeptidase PepV [Nosocomiicoccus sp. HMSC059G07]OFO53760.1 dipeptidase PepV [Nosocomiicoccus sp. HMSC059G07]
MNFNEIVNQYKDKILEDLNGLLSIESVRTEAKPGAPVGEGPKEALMYMLSLGDRDGMDTKVVDNLAGHIELGSGEKLFGILGHVDVVPAGTGWDSNPFEPVIKDDIIYARGVQDDKGPTIAAYYAMKILKDLEVPLNQRVRLIIGTGEESDWLCTDAYFKNEEMPDSGFAPDAEFPVIHGEKGITTFDIVFKSDDDAYGDIVLNTFTSGDRYNMVPESATANLTVKDVEKLKQSFESFLDEMQLKGDFIEDSNKVNITVFGKSAHGSTPLEGKNAGIELLRFLKVIPIDARAHKFVSFYDRYIEDNYDGKLFEMDFNHDEMGETSVNTGIIRYDLNDKSYFGVNLRYPMGMDFKASLNALKNDVEVYGVSIENVNDQVPHYVEKDSPLVKVLTETYRKHVDDDTEPFTIGGGTYARVLKNGVAYGAMFKDTKDTMHQANEQMKVEELLLATTIYLEALYEILVNGKLEK